MNQTETEEPTALTKALRALCKALSYKPEVETEASDVSEPPARR